MSTRRSQTSNFQKPSLVALFLVLTLVTCPAGGVYFNPMMSCKQFCQMLTKDYIRQVWCIIDICKDVQLRRKLVNYSKRSGGPSGVFDLLRPRDIHSYYDLYLSGLLDKKDNEYWNGPTPADKDGGNDRLVKDVA